MMVDGFMGEWVDGWVGCMDGWMDMDEWVGG